MPKIAKELSPVEVRRLMAKPGLHAVGGVVGLLLQVSRGRANADVLRRSWILRTTVRGRRPDIGLGSFPDVTLQRAREKARCLKEQIEAGLDPVEERRKVKIAARVEQARAMTFEECGQAYIAAHEAGWRNDKHRQQWRNTLSTYAYPVVGALPVQAVDTALVMKILEPIWQAKPETAGRVRGRIESILDWATVREFRTGENPARWKGHIDQLLPAKSAVRVVKHHAALPYAELPAFVTQLRGYEGVSPPALEVTILTALRTGAVIGAKRPEFDLQEKVWTVPAARMKWKPGQTPRDHRVPLCDRAIEILEALPQDKDSDFVFIGGRRGAPLSNMAMLKLLDRMGRSDLTVHGFRSAFKDWASETTGHPDIVVEMALAHAIPDQVERAYRRGDLVVKRRKLMEHWARYCASPRPDGKVIDLQQQRRAQ